MSSLVSTSSTVDAARTPFLKFGGGENSNMAVAASLVKTPVGNQQWSTFSISTPLFSSMTIDSNSSPTDGNLLASMSVRMAMFTEVNKRYLTKLTVFLDTMGDEKDAHVVVYDIGLMLLPKMLRSRFQEIRCTYVMGIPFPSYSVFCMFPHRQVSWVRIHWALLHFTGGRDGVPASGRARLRHPAHPCLARWRRAAA